MMKKIKGIMIVLSTVTLLECVIHYEYALKEIKRLRTVEKKSFAEHTVLRSFTISKTQEMLQPTEPSSSVKNISTAEKKPLQTLRTSKTQEVLHSKEPLSSVRSSSIAEHKIPPDVTTPKTKELLHSKKPLSNVRNSSIAEHKIPQNLTMPKTQKVLKSKEPLSSVKTISTAGQKLPQNRTSKTKELLYSKDQLSTNKNSSIAKLKTEQSKSKTEEVLKSKKLPPSVKNNSIAGLNSQPSASKTQKSTHSKELIISVKKGSTAEQQTLQNRTTSKIQSEGFHVIVTFRMMNITDKKENIRMNEYVDCLRSFLNNTLVKQVHVMHDSPEMPVYIREKTGANPKLLLHLVDSPDVVLTLHQFAFTHLQEEMVIITQADIMLGEGFEKLNRTFLMKNRLFYSLSRHEKECSSKPDYCKKYVGSHDTFVFVPNGSIPEEGKKILTHLIYSYGTENTVMHVYSNFLKYKVLNPCWIVKVYHHHCSLFRKYTKKQIRLRSNKYRSRPVERLV